MRFTIATIAAAAAFFGSASAHLKMSEPAQWASVAESDTTGGQFPLKEDGSDFPCQSMTPEDVAADYQPGSSNPLKLIGTAVHGGGSAQMLISYTFPPSNDPKQWRVMTSWQGGHPQPPADGGNYMPASAEATVPGEYSFKVPDFAPKGKAIVAWSWFNKIGNREHYMKCATVSIGGSTEEVKDAAEIKKLPSMFRANSGDPTACRTPDSVEIKFPYPGPDVVNGGSPEDIDCPVQEPGTEGGSSDSGSSTDSGSGSGSGSSPGSSSESAPAPTDTAAPLDNADGGSDDTPAPPASSTYAPAPPAATSAAPSKSEGSGSSSGGACTEGQITCNADGTWSQCGSGQLWNMGTTNGMACKDGAMQPAARARRALRAHRVRRAAHKH